MKPKLVKIFPNELYNRLVGGQSFVIRIGKAYWTPEYGSFEVNRGSLVGCHSVQPGAVDIGVVHHVDADLVHVRLVPQSDSMSGTLRIMVHIADVYCLFNPYKKKATAIPVVDVEGPDIWRLYMEYQGTGGTSHECTIKVDDDKKLLRKIRKDLRSQCDPESTYKYHIVKV